MRKVEMRNGKVCMFCEQADTSIRKKVSKFNEAGINVYIPYGNRQGVYTLNNTDKVYRLSIAGLLIPCGTTEEYDRHHEKMDEERLSFFAK